MANKNNKNTTLNDLASMVASGFEDISNRMATKDELREVKQGFSKLEVKVDDIYEILARFEEGDILDLQKRIKMLERTVKAMSKQLG